MSYDQKRTISPGCLPRVASQFRVIYSRYSSLTFAICAHFGEPFADLASSVTTEKSPTAPQPPRPTPFHFGRFHRTYLSFEYCSFFPTLPCFSSFCLKLTLSKTCGDFQPPAHRCQQISGQLQHASTFKCISQRPTWWTLRPPTSRVDMQPLHRVRVFLRARRDCHKFCAGD